MREPTGRILAIGDIHGGAEALAALLEEVRPVPDDLIITLGDYIDRGHDSRSVLTRLLRLGREARLIPLCGNHEEMMLGWLEGRAELAYMWWMNGGAETLASYGYPDEADPSPAGYGPPRQHEMASRLVPDTHWLFLRSCRDWYETEDFIFVHGNVDPDLDMGDQSPLTLHWYRFDRYMAPHKSGKKIICGHTPQLDGLPCDIGHAVCIDTFLYGGQWLSCLDLGNGICYQANELGETRRFRQSASGFKRLF